MKIIAKTSNAYMVEATKGELALIMGFKGQYGTDFKDDMIRIGKEIEIQRIDQVAKAQRN